MKTTPNVFLSYCWDDSSIADAIEEGLANYDVALTRDRRDLELLGDIEAFMSRIKTCDYAFVVISPRYLKSANCMYEALRTLDRGAPERLVPVFSADCDVFFAPSRLCYVEHWEKLIEELNSGVKRLGRVSNLHEILAQLERYEEIRRRIDEFMSAVARKNSLTEKQLRKDGISTLAKQLGLKPARCVPEPTADTLSRAVREFLVDPFLRPRSRSNDWEPVYLSVMDAVRHGAEGRAPESISALTAFCEVVSRRYSRSSHSRCRSTIRLVLPEKDGQGHQIRTIARSRNYSGVEEFVERIQQDPVFTMIREDHLPRLGYVINDLSSSSSYKQYRTNWASSFKSVLCIPIREELHDAESSLRLTAIRGVLSIDSEKKKSFDVADTRILSPICDLLYIPLRAIQP